MTLSFLRSSGFCTSHDFACNQTKMSLLVGKISEALSNRSSCVSIPQRQAAVTASTFHPVDHLKNANWPRTGESTAMAARISRSSALASAFRPAKISVQGRNNQVVRCLSTTSAQYVALPKDVKNMRMAPRDHVGTLEAPIVNPADKYQSKADNLHRYGAWLMGCMPKYIQQFSVWKDELTIYISPSGVIPVFSFLKCMLPIPSSFRIHCSLFFKTTPPPNSLSAARLPPPTIPPATSVSRLSITCSLSDTTPAFE